MSNKPPDAGREKLIAEWSKNARLDPWALPRCDPRAATLDVRNHYIVTGRLLDNGLALMVSARPAESKGDEMVELRERAEKAEAKVERLNTAHANTIQEAQGQAMEARTQKRIVLDILEALGLPDEDWNAVSNVVAKFKALDPNAKLLVALLDIQQRIDRLLAEDPQGERLRDASEDVIAVRQALHKAIREKTGSAASDDLANIDLVHELAMADRSEDPQPAQQSVSAGLVERAKAFTGRIFDWTGLTRIASEDLQKLRGIIRDLANSPAAPDPVEESERVATERDDAEGALLGHPRTGSSIVEPPTANQPMKPAEPDAELARLIQGLRNMPLGSVARQFTECLEHIAELLAKGRAVQS